MTESMVLDDTAVRSHRQSKGHRFSLSLGLVGVMTVLVSAWGGIVPFVGPVFGFSGDGSGSWYWDLSHALLALVPGALGIVAGLTFMATRGDRVAQGRLTVTGAGIVAIVCGAWFVVGPLAWPVVFGPGSYFVLASPLTMLEYWIGYALGPGVLLAMAGAFGLGWGARHSLPLGAGRSEMGGEVPPTTRSAVANAA